MEKYIIFVEGKADATFIRDYLCFLYPDFEIIKDNQKEKELKNSSSSVKIIVAGGYTALQKNLLN